MFCFPMRNLPPHPCPFTAVPHPGPPSAARGLPKTPAMKGPS